jgi:sterol carrier protein 2
MTELTWQLRGWCGQRQIPDLKYALQHNVGLGGAVVVGVLKKADIKGADKGWQDSRERFGYNPAVEARIVTRAEIAKIQGKDGALGLNEKLFEGAGAKL